MCVTCLLSPATCGIHNSCNLQYMSPIEGIMALLVIIIRPSARTLLGVTFTASLRLLHQVVLGYIDGYSKPQQQSIIIRLIRYNSFSMILLFCLYFNIHHLCFCPL